MCFAKCWSRGGVEVQRGAWALAGIGHTMKKKVIWTILEGSTGTLPSSQTRVKTYWKDSSLLRHGGMAEKEHGTQRRTNDRQPSQDLWSCWSCLSKMWGSEGWDWGGERFGNTKYIDLTLIYHETCSGCHGDVGSRMHTQTHEISTGMLGETHTQQTQHLRVHLL